MIIASGWSSHFHAQHMNFIHSSQVDSIIHSILLHSNKTTKHQKCTHKLAKLIWSISACMWIVEIILQELLGKHYDDFKVFHQQFGKYAQPSVHDSCINVRKYMYWICFFLSWITLFAWELPWTTLLNWTKQVHLFLVYTFY